MLGFGETTIREALEAIKDMTGTPKMEMGPNPLRRRVQCCISQRKLSQTSAIEKNLGGESRRAFLSR